MNFIKLACLLIVALLTSNTAFGKSNNPQAIAKEYFSVMQRDGLTSVGKFMHPSALSEFKSMLIPVFEAEENSGQRQLMDVTFGKSSNISNLKKMKPVTFMNGFMNLVAAQTGSAQVTFDKLEILGTIEEGDARHVLTRITVGMGELALTQFEVLSFIPHEGSWRLQLNGKMKGIAKALQSKVMRN